MAGGAHASIGAGGATALLPTSGLCLGLEKLQGPVRVVEFELGRGQEDWRRRGGEGRK